jgi:hypothetical protein
LTGLIVYVLMIEPNAPLSAQWLSWKLAFTALTVLVGLVALCAWRSPRNPELEPAEKPTDPNAPLVAQLVGRGPATWPRRLYWFAAAAIPVALMMGLTDYLTLDLAPAPILWTLPIAIYLFAFSQAFARFSIYKKGSFVVKLIVQLLFGLGAGAALAALMVSLINFDLPGDPLHATPTVLCVILFGVILLIPSSWLHVLQPLSAVVVVFLQANVFKLPGLFMPTVFLHVVCYYFTVRLCFNMLAKDRPVAAAITTYYNWIGLGGLTGGVFQLLIAPWLFRGDYLEYAFAIALACTLRPAWQPHGLSDWLACLPFLPKPEANKPQPVRAKVALAFDLALPIGATSIVALLFLLRWHLPEFIPRPNEHFLVTGLRHLFIDYPLVLAMSLAFALIARPMRFGLTLTGIVLVCWIGSHHDPHETLLVRQRTDFGILRVAERKKPLILPREERQEFTERYLMHGTTHHGSCITDPMTLRRHPTTYYHRKGPVGDVMRKLEWFGYAKDEANKQPRDFWLTTNRDNAKDDARIAASIIGLGASGYVEPIAAAWSEPPFAFVGLGVGSLFTYAHPYQCVDAYELDPAIVALSEEEQPMFPYFQAAQKRGVNAKLHIGDGRRLLTQAGREGFYHVLFIDALNSNAVPTHLLTKEAIETYFHKLAPDGVVCFHTSNRTLELAKVLDRIARRLDIAMATVQGTPNDLDSTLFFASEWVVLARNKEVMRKWSEAGGFPWRADVQPFQDFLRRREAERLLWTDEHASVFAAVRSGQPLPSLVYGSLGVLLAFAAIMAIIEMATGHAKPAMPAPAKKRDV